MAILAYLSLKKAEAESLDIFIHSIIPNFMLSSAEHEIFFITSGQELRQIFFFRIISGGKKNILQQNFMRLIYIWERWLDDQNHFRWEKNIIQQNFMRLI